MADDQLRLMFTCCHPALAPAAQVALTLRLVCGLRTDEIARAFLQPEATVAQRLSRAKAKIRATNIPFRVPPGRLLAERLPPVLACVYLVFTEGYAATGSDELIRHELCDEGVRLARLLAELLPDEPEAHGAARPRAAAGQPAGRPARRRRRAGAAGGPGPRRAGTGPASPRARPSSTRAQGIGPAGPVPAAGHHRRRARRRAPSWDATDWPRIAALYAVLARRSPSPVVELNRAVAVAFADGPAAGLAVLDAVADDPRLARLAPAARHPGRPAAPARAGPTRPPTQYRAALALVRTAPERSFLERPPGRGHDVRGG